MSIKVTDIWGQPMTHSFRSFEEARRWARALQVKYVRKVEEMEGRQVTRRWYEPTYRKRRKT